MTTTLEAAKTQTLAELVALPQDELIAAIQSGLSVHLAGELAERLALTQEQLARLLRLTPRTLQRRWEEGQLELAESERLWELARLLFRAVEVLESEAAAVRWLESPIQALAWKTPLAVAQTAVGLRELDNVLGRIEHGVFS